VKESQYPIFRGEVCDDEDEIRVVYVVASCLHEALAKLSEYADPFNGLVASVEIMDGPFLVDDETHVVKEKKRDLTVVPEDAS
jgi:hypothetical protein